MDIETYFLIADNNLNCNTSYPVYKDSFKKYTTDEDIMAGVSNLSFYIHIPFCKNICGFCEYTRFLAGDLDAERHYLTMLEDQIDSYQNTHPIHKIYGFDIGGGTPTSLSEDNFQYLMEIAQKVDKHHVKADDYENSIEFSFATITEKKLERIQEAGFRRISTGIQSADSKLMCQYERKTSSLEYMKRTIRYAHDLGIPKVNIDLMYGLVGQDNETIDKTLNVIENLMPEHVTLYETRYNMNGLKHTSITRDVQFKQYKRFYEKLIEMGYNGRFGRNTFTLCDDQGVSSYLYHRMIDGTPYKGFGISAQSMSHNGISYGICKDCCQKKFPEIKSLGLEYNYELPPDEIVAKYVSIAMYSASFRLDVLSIILKENASLYFKNELDFLLEKKLIQQIGNNIVLTPEGFRYYGAICALFWTDEQKELLMKEAKS